MITMDAKLNTTVNGTRLPNCSIRTDSGDSKAAKIGITFAFSLILVVSLVGNLVIAIVVYKTKTLRRTINYFIVNMAMSDLLFPLFIHPSFLIELYGDGIDVFSAQDNWTFCTVRLFFLYVTCLISVVSMVFLAVDRFGAVVFPLRPPLISSKLCPYVIFATWLVLSALSSPAFFANEYVYTGKLKCEWQTKESYFKNYSYAIPIVICAISFLLIIILYSIILFKLKSQKIPGEKSINAVEKRIKMHRNVFKMVVAIVIAFILCWMPYCIFISLHVFVWDNTNFLYCDRTPFWFFSVFMIHVNCAINPCLCFTFSGNFRQGLKGLFCYQVRNSTSTAELQSMASVLGETAVKTVTSCN